MSAVCELRGVGKRYGLAGPWVLRHVEGELQAGQVVRVEGANGSGKSTLLRLIAGATRPSAGAVVRSRAQVGFAPDHLPADLPLRARTYLRHQASVRGLARQEADRRIQSLTDGFGLTSDLHRRTTALSKGTAHKVVLCQALLDPGPLVVLDEPWSGLDGDASEHLAQRLRCLRADGTCVVIAEHGSVPAEVDIDLSIQVGGGETRIVPRAR